MPAPLRWLVLLALTFGAPFLLISQLTWLFVRDESLSRMIGLGVGSAYFIATWIVASQLPRLYAKYYEAKKLSGSQYQNHLRAYAQSCEKLKISAPELLIINDGAPIAMGVGLSPAGGKIIVTRGLFDGLEPDQFQAYLTFILVQFAKGHIAPMTFGCAAAWVALLPLKLADIADSEPLRVLLTIIFGWLGALYLQASGMRSQAYEIDQLAGASHGHGGHLALGSALNQADKVLFKHGLERIDYSSSPLWVVNPLGSKGVAAIFATHSPTPKRVKKLQRAGTKVVGKEAVAKSKGLV